MKKILLVLIILTVFVGSAQAGYRYRRAPTQSIVDVHNKAGVKIDMPHLVGIPQISKHLFIGLEGGKDIATDLFYGTNYIEDDKGYFGYIKITYNGCLLNCNK